MPRNVPLMALSPLVPATTPYHLSPMHFDVYRKHPRRLPCTMLLPHGDIATHILVWLTLPGRAIRSTLRLASMQLKLHFSRPDALAAPNPYPLVRTVLETEAYKRRGGTVTSQPSWGYLTTVSSVMPHPAAPSSVTIASPAASGLRGWRRPRGAPSAPVAGIRASLWSGVCGETGECMAWSPWSSVASKETVPGRD
jgi:hypothetical protein